MDHYLTRGTTRRTAIRTFAGGMAAAGSRFVLPAPEVAARRKLRVRPYRYSESFGSQAPVALALVSVGTSAAPELHLAVFNGDTADIYLYSWLASTGEWHYEATYPGGVAFPSTLCFSPDGLELFIGGQDENDAVRCLTRQNRHSFNFTDIGVVIPYGLGTNQVVAVSGIAIAPSGTTLAVSDWDYGRVKIFGRHIPGSTTWTQQFFLQSSGTTPMLNPTVPGFSVSGNRLYVPEWGNDIVSIWQRRTQGGVDWLQVGSFGQSGNGPEDLGRPMQALCLPATDEVYVADIGNQRISIWDEVRKKRNITWQVQATIGENPSHSFDSSPSAIAVAPDGNVAVIAFFEENIFEVWTRR